MRDAPRWSIRRAAFILFLFPSLSLLNISCSGIRPSPPICVFVRPLSPQVWTSSRGRDCRPRLSCEMKDGTAVALGDDLHPPWHTHTRACTRTPSLPHTHVRPALSFAAEMVPAWANLHNTLLTPLLYSSITPRQLLQVQAFVWACLWLCKARHKRLISQLFFFAFFFLFFSLLRPFPLPLFLLSFPPPPSSLSSSSSLVHPSLSFHRYSRMTAAR